MKNNKIILYIAVLIEASLWGFSFVGTKVALESVSAIELLAMRWTIGAVALILLIPTGIVKFCLKSKPLLPLLSIVVFQPCVYSITECLGIERTTASEAAIIIAMVPIAVLLISIVFLKKKIGFKTVLAILWTFTGVTFMFSFSPDFSLGGKLWGYLLLLAAVISGSIYTIRTSGLSSLYEPMEITVVMATVGAIFFNLVSLAKGNGLGCYSLMFRDSSLFQSMIFLGFGCTAFCYVCYNLVISSLPPHQAAALQVNIITIVAVLSGIFIRGDAFGWYTAMGLVMVLSGLVLTNITDVTDMTDSKNTKT